MEKFNLIKIENRLNNSHRGEDKKINKILDAYLKIQGKQKKFQEKQQTYYWGPEHFNLHQSSLFMQSTPEQQRSILEKCSRNLISESYFVEKSASAYCAKMMMLANTTEIAQTYSMIANEEAIHLAWLTPYMPIEDRHDPKGAFLQFLSSLIEECDSNLLPYLVQIILEGWGLHHYKSLARDCLNEQLKSVFLDIMRDEALHHHTGEVIFDHSQVTDSQHLFLEKCLKTYAEMVRVGPQDLILSLEETLGGISPAEKRKLLLDIEYQKTTTQKLALLKELMTQPGMEKTVQKLENEGYFTVLNEGVK